VKLYLAARYSSKDTMRKFAEELERRGVEITSRWLQEEFSSDTKLTDLDSVDWMPYAKIDIEDIRRSTAMLFFAEDPDNQPPRGGRHVEFGFAIALGITIFVAGGKENLFHYLPEVKHYRTFSEFVRKEINGVYPPTEGCTGA
jgi:hypothetical protein